MELRSELPGRERWYIPELVGAQAVAARVESVVRGTAGVTSVRANAVTGTLLVEFGEESPVRGQGLPSRLESVLDAAVRGSVDADAQRVGLKSLSPGRQRWFVPELLKHRTLAARVQQVLTARLPASTVSASPVTGSLLLVFAGTVAEARALVLEALETAARTEHSQLTLESHAERERARFPALGYWLGAGALVAVPRIALGAAAAANPLVLGLTFVGAAIVTSVGVLDYLRGRILERAETAGPLRRLIGYLRPFRRDVLLAAACSVMRKIVDFAPPIFIGIAVNIASGRPLALFAALGVSSLTGQITLLGVVAWLTYLVESSFEYAFKSRWRLLAQNVQHRMRVDAYAHGQLVHLRYLGEQRTGNLTTIINDNVNQLQLFLDDGVNSLLEIGTNVLVIVAAFAILAPQVAWIGLLPIPVIAWIAVRYHERIGPVYMDVQNRSAAVSNFLVNNFGGIATIRSFGTEEHELDRLSELSKGYLKANGEGIRRFARFEPTARLPIQTTFATLLILAGRNVIAGRISEGAFASILFLLPRFLFPFAYFGQTIDRYQRAMAAVGRVFDLLDKPIGPVGGEQPLPRAAVRGEIEFRDVGFGYRPDVPVLETLQLRIEAGKTIGIVGATGSGKTTLVKLLLRFYDPDRGRILVDGWDVRQLRSRDLRDAIGLVSQDVFLFDGTIRENIAYGSDAVDPSAIEEAARMAEVMPFVNQLPERLETQVGERGANLSGGQRQRVSLARAILKNPPILVLDEATASLDNETEAAIQRSLSRITRGRTTIVIAHRLSTVRHAHRIVVLGAGGRVVEAGSHEELLRESGVYAGLWRVQTGEAAHDGSVPFTLVDDPK